MVKVRFDVVEVLGMSGYLLTDLAALATCFFHSDTRILLITARASSSCMFGS